MDAILVVGGQGTRLRPLTITTPKPMLPTAGVPFTAHQLALVRAGGVDRVVFATSYKPEVFAAHFGEQAYGLELDYVTEREPLGTGGALRHVADHLDGSDVVVFNGDILCGLDLAAMVEAHRSARADVTIYLHPVEDVRPFGMVPTDDTSRVTAFLEKPERPEDVVTHDINAGCYIFRRELIDAIPAGRPVSVEREVFPRLLADGAFVLGHVDTSYWLDVGTPASFVRGSCDLVLGRVASAALPGPTGDALLLEDAHVDPGATVDGGTTVGARSVIGRGARVSGCVLFDDVSIEPGARLQDSVVASGTVVGEGCVLSEAVLADGVRLGRRNELRSGARVYPGVQLGDVAVRFSKDV